MLGAETQGFLELCRKPLSCPLVSQGGLGLLTRLTRLEPKKMKLGALGGLTLRQSLFCCLRCAVGKHFPKLWRLLPWPELDTALTDTIEVTRWMPASPASWF